MGCSMHRCRRWNRAERHVFWAALCLALAAMVALSVSSGCTKQPAPKSKAELDKQKKLAKPKPPFDAPKVYTAPCFKEAPAITRAVKPGHWAGVLVETKANLFDFSGDLESTAVDAGGNGLDLDNSAYRLLTAAGR